MARPTVFMNSGDGVSGGDQIVLSAGSHRHVNWAFTTPGVYEVDFEALRDLGGGKPVDFERAGDLYVLSRSGA